MLDFSRTEKVSDNANSNMTPILTVLPFYTGDADLALKLLKWMKRLNQGQSHLSVKVQNHNSILLAADSKTPVEICKEIGSTAREQFKHVIPLSIRVDSEGVRAANAMFFNCAQWIKNTSRLPFLWCEPDCVPVQPGWLNKLEEAYEACPTHYMGTVVPGSQPNLPAFHLPGCAVYPQNAFDLMAPFCNAQQVLAFDMAAADALIKGQHVTKTNLIQSLWGEQDLPPTFVSERQQGVVYDPNVITPDFIKPETVLFHRVKNGSLFDALANKLKLK
jgi:hypothetical protein